MAATPGVFILSRDRFFGGLREVDSQRVSLPDIEDAHGR